MDYDLVHRLIKTIEENRDGHDYTYCVFVDQLGVAIRREADTGDVLVLRFSTENARVLADQLRDAADRRDCA